MVILPSTHGSRCTSGRVRVTSADGCSYAAGRVVVPTANGGGIGGSAVSFSTANGGIVSGSTVVPSSAHGGGVVDGLVVPSSADGGVTGGGDGDRVAQPTGDGGGCGESLVSVGVRAIVSAASNEGPCTAGGVVRAPGHGGAGITGGVVVPTCYGGVANTGFVAPPSTHGGIEAAGGVADASGHSGVGVGGFVAPPSTHSGVVAAGNVALSSADGRAGLAGLVVVTSAHGSIIAGHGDVGATRNRGCLAGDADELPAADGSIVGSGVVVVSPADGGTEAAGGVVCTSGHGGAGTTGGVIVPSGHGGVANTGFVAVPSPNGGTETAGGVIVPSCHGGGTATGGVAEASGHGGVDRTRRVPVVVTCPVPVAPTHGAVIVGHAVGITAHTPASDGGTHHAGGHAVAAVTADEVGADARLDAQRPLTVHLDLQGLVVGGAQEVVGGIGAAVARQRPERAAPHIVVTTHPGGAVPFGDLAVVAGLGKAVTARHGEGHRTGLAAAGEALARVHGGDVASTAAAPHIVVTTHPGGAVPFGDLAVVAGKPPQGVVVHVVGEAGRDPAQTTPGGGEGVVGVRGGRQRLAGGEGRVGTGAATRPDLHLQPQRRPVEDVSEVQFDGEIPVGHRHVADLHRGSHLGAPGGGVVEGKAKVVLAVCRAPSVQ